MGQPVQTGHIGKLVTVLWRCLKPSPGNLELKCRDRIRVKNQWAYAKAWTKTGMSGLVQQGKLVGMKGVNKEQPCSRPPDGWRPLSEPQSPSDESREVFEALGIIS